MKRFLAMSVLGVALMVFLGCETVEERLSREQHQKRLRGTTVAATEQTSEVPNQAPIVYREDETVSVGYMSYRVFRLAQEALIALNPPSLEEKKEQTTSPEKAPAPKKAKKKSPPEKSPQQGANL